MTAGTAKYSGITRQAGTVYASAMYALTKAPVLAPTITLLSDLTGMAPRRATKYPTVSFSAGTDGTDFSTWQGIDATITATLTPAEYVSGVLITDQRAESDPANVMMDAGIIIGQAAADHMDANIAKVFATFTGGTITKSAGAGTITWQDVDDARSMLIAAGVRGPYVLALHPYQWTHLRQAAAGYGATGTFYQNAPAFGDSALRAGQLLMTSLFPDLLVAVSGNVQRASSGTAGTAALYAPLAAALDVRRPLRVEPERNASLRGVEMVASMVYAYGAWDPARGITIIGNAVTPS